LPSAASLLAKNAPKTVFVAGGGTAETYSALQFSSWGREERRPGRKGECVELMRGMGIEGAGQ